MSGEVILFAEDEIRQLKLMQRFFEAKGYRVLAAQDGVEAVQLYRRHKNEIALVVLDIKMPKLDGWNAFQEMKKEDPKIRPLLPQAIQTLKYDLRWNEANCGICL